MHQVEKKNFLEAFLPRSSLQLFGPLHQTIFCYQQMSFTASTILAELTRLDAIIQKSLDDQNIVEVMQTELPIIVSGCPGFFFLL